MAENSAEITPGRKRWQKIADRLKNGEFKNNKSSPTKFSWANIPLAKLVPLKSDDLNKVLLSENDKLLNRTGAASFVGRFELSDMQDLLVTASTHWLLTHNEVKCHCQPLVGFVEDADVPWNADKVIALLPQMRIEDKFQLKKQEIHQVLRELVVGIYVFNQLPAMSLDSSTDMSTLCRLPPAYMDTLVGQSLIEVDYMVKCIWLGAFMSKDKRFHFKDNWKSIVEQKSPSKHVILNDFLHAGMQDVSDVENYKNIYDDVTSNDNKSTEAINGNQLRLNFNLAVQSWHQMGTIIVLDTGYTVSYVAPPNVKEHVKLQLRRITQTINAHLTENDEIRRAVEILRCVAALLPILICLKKRRKIPNIAYLKPPISRSYCSTETELPPLIVGPNFVRNELYRDNRCLGVEGGVKFDVETPPLVETFPPELAKCLRKRLITYDNGEDVKVRETRGPIDEQPLASFVDDKRRYYILEIQLENCLSKNCQRPYWTSAIHTELSWHMFKTLPKTSTQIEDQIKLHFDLTDDKWSTKTLVERLHTVASRALAAAFHSLLRDVYSNNLDETFNPADGWSLLHTAAKCDSVSVVTQLVHFGIDVNVQSIGSKGETALHVAAEFGSLEVITCLLSFGADPTATNSRGWAPIHTAAYFNQLPTIILMNRHCDQMALATNDNLKRIPVHLSAINGSLEALHWFLDKFRSAERSIDPNVKDDTGCNIVQLATLNSQIHVLKYFIKDRIEVNVWKSMSEMLLSITDKWRIAAVRCIRLLSEETVYLNGIVKAGMQSTLVGLLQDVAIIQPHVVATLSQMSCHDTVQQALRDPKLIQVLVKLLSCNDDVTASQAASILGDVVVDQHSRSVVGAKGGVEALADLLKDPLKSALILSALKAISSVCNCHGENQDRVAQTNCIVARLVTLLAVQSDEIRGMTCSTLVVVAKSHPVNQSNIIDAGGVKHIRYLLTIRHPKLQKKSAELLRELVMDNQTNQTRLLEMGVLQPTISMLKGSDVELKEVAADAIWAMAGSGTAQRRLVAQKIGTNSLINMLLTKSPILVCTSCPLVAATVYEVPKEQLKFLEEGGVHPLIRQLHDRNSTQNVQTAIFQTLSTLCLGAAYGGNSGVQDELYNEEVVSCLLELIGESALSEPHVEVEAVHLLACAVLRHKNNMKTLKSSKYHLCDFVDKHLMAADQAIRITAAMSLALFVLNRNTDWNRLKSQINIDLNFFKALLQSASNECHQCMAAFQMCVLAPLVIDADDASCIVVGVQLLANKLTQNVSDEREDIFVLSASLSQCLLNAVGGFADAIVSLGVIDSLVKVLTSDGMANIRPTCASTLAALSRHQSGRMKLISLCRRKPDLYGCLRSNVPEGVSLCPKFNEKFQQSREFASAK